MKFLFVSFLLALTGFSSNVQADFSRVSSQAFGPGALTSDSNQGLYWLAPSLTVGMSYSEVAGLLANDPSFSGYRYASVGELESLFSGFDIPNLNDLGVVINGTVGNVPGATALQSFLGVTYSVLVGGVSIAETAGFVGEPFVSPINGFVSVYLGDVAIRSNVQTDSGPMSFAYVASVLSSATVGSQYEGVGSWLVTSVPEPSQFGLFVAGLFVTVVFTRRKMRHR